MFKNLRTLICNTNYLKTLDIDGMNINTLKTDENALETIICGSAPVSNVNVSVSSYSNLKGLIDPDGNTSTTFTISGTHVQMVQVVGNSNLEYLNTVQCPSCFYIAVSGCKPGMKIHVNRSFSGNPNGLPAGAEVIKE